MPSATTRCTASSHRERRSGQRAVGQVRGAVALLRPGATVATASVTSTASGRAVSASRSIAGCTCTPSAMIDGTSRRSSSAAPAKPGRAVVQRAHAVEEVRDDRARRRRPRRARRRSRRCCARARRRRRGRAASRSRASPGSASGASVTRRTRSPKRSHRLGEPLEVDRPHELDAGARRARRRGTVLRGARRAPRRDARRAPRPAARASARTRRAARCRSSAGTPCTRRRSGASIVATISSTDAVAKSTRAGAVHLDVDEARHEQRVAEVDRRPRAARRCRWPRCGRRPSRARPERPRYRLRR